MPTSSTPTIVLVHGAWADASSWNAVIVPLQAEGYTVFAPPNELRGLTGDAAYIASFLAQRTSGPVVLVGHSYGGAVITNAGAQGGDVKALVYVDAFIPDEGETVVSILEGSGSALAGADPTTVLDVAGYPGAPEGAAEAFLKPETVHTAFAQDLSEQDRWTIVATQRPASFVANVTPSGPPAWKSIPSWAVLGVDDLVIPIDTQRRMAERAGSTITEVDASHVSMVSHPDVTLAAIRAAVESIS
ncbi:pimeloyl-ACP methyl ester carboxylesterase [Okibacterium sp. HSC-33S16]|uniref:alpha/beta fold hydrolase n=1 Tax=Okibacterium sp. HSC-33S16 TaxID=2910965 RepID=UPI00209CA0D8|nr:alpha/beta hydrolase [Okibacterium sp. HSC-33S16]MCP2032630.1 pimeloyl-ACP methyl ester carboxylesterase [Okibacterium sp. HSC-33S16]